MSLSTFAGASASRSILVIVTSIWFRILSSSGVHLAVRLQRDRSMAMRSGIFSESNPWSYQFYICLGRFDVC